MDIKRILQKHGFYFKKAYGQNFLTDEFLLDDIVTSAGITKEDTVIEIGCGAGTLTRAIAKHAGKVIGYEIDTKLTGILDEMLSDFDNVEIVFEDIMKQNIAEIEKNFSAGYYVVANLPYYITTPILMKFLEESKYVKGLVVTVQKEVALRLSAKENTADYGAITAMINLVGDAYLIKHIGREQFLPPPSVDSAVVKIVLNRDKFKLKSVETYREMVKIAFGNRRKTLCNNLMNSLKIARAQAEDILTSCDIDLLARGETLSAEKFVILSDYVYELRRKNG
ncbi:MAG: ribosomal RNA small subunit methyltransferase A [Clostridia bacterium]|nr:ribosomal RNA small subunit methyltransferase A [Clostridia bacterium]